MLAIVNANYEFMNLDIGNQWCKSDASVIEHTTPYQLLQTCNETLEGMNFVFVADDAFTLGEQLLKPFPMRNMTTG